MRRIFQPLVLVLIAVLGAASFAWLALSRGEQVNAAWLLTAAICTYIIIIKMGKARFAWVTLLPLSGSLR